MMICGQVEGVQTRDLRVNLNCNVACAQPSTFASPRRHLARPFTHSRDRYTDANDSYIFVPEGGDAQALTINRSSGEVGLNRMSSLATNHPN